MTNQYEPTQQRDRLWTYEEPLRYRGIEMGHTMSVIIVPSTGISTQT